MLIFFFYPCLTFTVFIEYLLYAGIVFVVDLAYLHTANV